MKISLSAKRDWGLTLIELFVVIAVLFIVVCLLFPMPRRASRAPRISCVNNLKQTGLDFRVWEGDNGDKYPTAVSETNGGSMEFNTGPNAFRHFLVMSNELSTPKILFCPAETDRNRFIATNWNINNSNISYFVGIDAKESSPGMILGGDHNLINGATIKNGILELTTNQPAGWTAEMHNKVGNILLADGSVQQVDVPGLRKLIENSGVATNRLQMPVLTP
jgi:prepilin-type processing-associated H-X9-DG protein